MRHLRRDHTADVRRISSSPLPPIRSTLFRHCAEAHGAEIAGRKVETFGDAGCFSFYYRLTNDAEIARLRSRRPDTFPHPIDGA
jgi:hypothetical protein